VCTRLIADLAARGLDATRGVLFVVDGGKVINNVFGALVVTQRSRSSRRSRSCEITPAA
jgi:hypothetical protein